MSRGRGRLGHHSRGGGQKEPHGKTRIPQFNPDPTLASGTFAGCVLTNGDVVTISATGLAADRIQVVADGAGLTGDGIADAFYLFSYTRAADVVPVVNIGAAAPGFAVMSWTPAAPGFRLQANSSLSPATWMNAVSNETNPVVVPFDRTSLFYRLIRP